MQKFQRILLIIPFIFVSALVVFASNNDWDQFLTFFEVDLRSWLVDHSPPLWSYQFCAGVTRIGDPQSFGLSPLFFPIIIFGSFWGTKLLTIGLLFWGFVYATKLFQWFFQQYSSDIPSNFLCQSLGVFTIFGNYLLWHVYEGHLTFALFPLVISLLYFFLKACKEGISKKLGWGIVAVTFCYCSAGFYHSLIYLALPLLYSFLLGLPVVFLFQRLRWNGILWKNVLGAVALLLLASFLASYKWMGVLEYQKLHPRILEHLPETNSVSHLLFYLFAPTFNHLFLGFHDVIELWGVYEYSAFSLVPWFVIYCLCWAAVKKQKEVVLLFFQPEIFFPFLLALFLALGDSSPLPLHHLLNKTLYHDSVRVVGRYHFLLLFILSIWLVRVLATQPVFRKVYEAWLAPIGLFITALSVASFFSIIDLKRFQSLAFTPTQIASKMDTLVMVPKRVIALTGDSFMYPAIRLSGIVPNCYQPISRSSFVADESGVRAGIASRDANTFDLLRPGLSAISKECRDSVFVTQNEVHFNATACPTDICFHINMLNPYRNSGLELNKDRMLYCRK